MSRFIKLVVVALLAFSFNVTAQEGSPASDTGNLSDPILIPSIADQIKNGTASYAALVLGQPKGRAGNQVVPGKGFPKGVDPLLDQQRNAEQTPVRAANLVFTANISQATPYDPTGAAGPNHYVAAWNSAYGRTAISVFNLAGQKLAHNNLTKQGNQFHYSLDMSYVAAGIYCSV